MILTKEVEVRITPYNINHYINLGYNVLYNIKIVVPIKHLSKNSNVRVCVKCDVCEKEKIIKYYDYLKNFNNGHLYCCCSKCCQIKVKKTSFEKYGVEFTFQNKTFREKGKKTNLKKYGVENARQNEEIKEKIKTNFLKKYGVDNPMKDEDIKNKSQETCLKKYGVKYIAQTQDFKNNSKATLLKKFGVENGMQNENVHNKQQLSGFFLKLHEKTGLYYRGTYEKHFLDFCFENDIKVVRGKTIKYFFDGKNRVYFSDFYLEEKNLIIEIKSSYYLKKYLSKNLAKQEATIKSGYSYIFIIDKVYDEFLNIIK